MSQSRRRTRSLAALGEACFRYMLRQDTRVAAIHVARGAMTFSAAQKHTRMASVVFWTFYTSQFTTSERSTPTMRNTFTSLALAAAAYAQEQTYTFENQTDPGLYRDPLTAGPSPELIHLYNDQWPTGMSSERMLSDPDLLSTTRRRCIAKWTHILKLPTSS